MIKNEPTKETGMSNKGLNAIPILLKKNNIIATTNPNDKASVSFTSFIDRLMNLVLSRDMSVSYTHLDVYKRQILLW